VGGVLELRQVETFRAVAEELSFSRAAAKLGYVQSSVSVQVAALEQELGVPLFDRLGRRITLTEGGEVLLSHSRKLLELAEQTKQAVADTGAGSGAPTR
jgi:DNA-binding transcriptional LysR family regulator